MSKSDQHIKQAIEGVFSIYDVDRNNTLDYKQLRPALIETFKKLGINKKVTESDLKHFMDILDKNDDGKVSRAELY